MSSRPHRRQIPCNSQGHTMATRDEVFPSKYLKAADLGGKPITVLIERADEETLKTPEGREDVKTVFSFKGAKKALPLNMTNWDSVAEITGEGDTARWPGTRSNCIRPRPRCRAKPPLHPHSRAGPARVAEGQAARADATADAGRPRRQNSVLSCPGPQPAPMPAALFEDLPCCAPHWRWPSEDCIFAARCAQLRLTLKCQPSPTNIGA